MAINKEYTFGLIGCGRIGERHASLISSFGKLKAVCDIESEKVLKFADFYTATPYTNIDVLLETENEIDVIVICTPNSLHSSQSVAALNKGFHVLCEKPMALNLVDCNKMVDAALRNDRMLHVVKQNRFNPPIVYLKNLLDEGMLGQIYSVSLQCFWNRNKLYYEESNWKGSIEFDGGILYTQFSHFIDVACWMFGKMECAGAFGQNYAHKGLIEFDDTIVALVKFDKGVMGTFHFSINAFDENMEGSIAVLGEKGAVTIGGQYLNKLTYHKVKGMDMPSLSAERQVNDYFGYKGTMNNHADVYGYLIKSLEYREWHYNDLHVSVLTIDAIQSINRVLENRM